MQIVGFVMTRLKLLGPFLSGSTSCSTFFVAFIANLTEIIAQNSFLVSRTPGALDRMCYSYFFFLKQKRLQLVRESL